jgi:hypothetical protein
MFVDRERQEEKQKRRTNGKVMADEKLHLGDGGGKSIILLEGSQALPVRPSDKASMKVKNLELSEAVA